MHIYIYTYIYIYVERERERQRQRCTYIYIYIYVYTRIHMYIYRCVYLSLSLYVYIYIYIYTYTYYTYMYMYMFVCTSACKLLHTRDQTSLWVFQWHFPTGSQWHVPTSFRLLVVFSKGLSLSVDFYRKYPKDFQGHFQMTFHFCDFWPVIFRPGHRKLREPGVSQFSAQFHLSSN